MPQPLTLRRVAGCAALFGGLALPAASLAQATPRRAVVVQVAGATLYLNAGTDAGLRTGDTLLVRRVIDGPLAGSLVVVGASATRSVLSFAGPAFSVTRGDTLLYVPRAEASAAVSVAVPATPPARAPPVAAPAQPRARVDGTVGVEMWGSHSETVGLGSQPLRTTRDIGMPAVRFNTLVSGDRSSLRVNIRAQQLTGPDGLWDNQTRIRIYEARYDLRLRGAQLTVGRFYSDFDHMSAFWDGASVRFGDEQGLSAGVAAGFEPERGNEIVSFDRPKASAFVGTRHRGERVSLETDLAFTQTMPSDRAQWRSGADFALYLRAGRFSLTGDLEATPPTPMGRWGVSRAQLRTSMPAGQRGTFYAAAVSDRLTPLDTALLAPFSRRDRVTSGFSLFTAGGAFFDVNASLNDPGQDASGYAAGATLSVPRVLAGGTVSMHGSWFDDGNGTGFLASPAVEYRLRGARIRGGYQFYSVDQPSGMVQSHAVDLRLWQPFGPRMSGVLQASQRFGHNLSSTTLFTSFEVRF